MDRKLASIQRIKEVLPIENADSIELVKVLGWQCVSKKGEFKPGDLCVYFEIDSFLPIRKEFEFLRSSSYKNNTLLGEGFRLKTMKMRGELSQGLVLPISILDSTGLSNFEEGTDVTELLGVKKWEMPEMITTGGTTIGRLPYFIPHSNETRIQNVPEILSEFGNHKYYISTKMDGSSHAIGLDENNEFYVCGHNYRYKDDGKSSFYNFVNQKGFENKLLEYKSNNPDITTIAIIGEFCGEGIQKNRLKLTSPAWYAFTVMINQKRVSLDKAKDVVFFIGADFVPVEEIGDSLMVKYPDVEAILKRAEGEYPNGGQKEGIVVRTIEPIYSGTLLESLSFKAINNKYLLKQKD